MNKNIKSFSIVTRKDWMVLAGILLICLGLVNWMFFGVLRTTGSSVGVVTNYDDSIEVHFPGSGVISELCVERNSYVNKGDVVARVYRLDNQESNHSLESDMLIADILSKSEDIKSNVSGYISYADKNKWDYVDYDDTIMHICKADEDTVIGTYIYARVRRSYVGQVTEGETKALIELDNNPKETYGYLTGTVLEKYYLPRNREQIERETGSTVVADFLFAGDDYDDIYVVLIKVDTDPNTKEPLFTIKQPGEEILLNEQCKVTYILSESHPYERIFNTIK